MRNGAVQPDPRTQNEEEELGSQNGVGLSDNDTFNMFIEVKGVTVAQ